MQLATAALCLALLVLGASAGPHTKHRNVKAKEAKKPPSTKNCSPENPCLLFEDNFDFLNFENWQHEITAGGGGNWEFQYYTNNRTNSYTKDGLLYLKPTLTSEQFGEEFLTSGLLSIWGASPANLCTGNAWWGCERGGNPDNLINPIQSARVRTVNSFSTRYGRVEVEAQNPKGDWIWPAIWMMPTYDAYGGWPASGEIDIMESRGNLDLTDGQGNSFGHDHMGATMHWGPDVYNNGYLRTMAERNGNFADEMHKYRIDWYEDKIEFYLDDELILDVDPPAGGFWELGEYEQAGLPETRNPWRRSANQKMAPFDQPFYIILNVAVGGTNGFFPDSFVSNPPKPWSNESPFAPRDFWNGRDSWLPSWNMDENEGEGAAMKVNYVRVWQIAD